jgi:hypothetical protein
MLINARLAAAFSPQAKLPHKTCALARAATEHSSGRGNMPRPE